MRLRWDMNSTRRQDTFNDAFIKNFITLALGAIINCINGSFVYTYFKSQVFQQDPRYVLYIHLVINDMIMLTVSIVLQVFTYTTPVGLGPCCVLLLIALTTNKNSPLNLAGMAVERYIAVCRPLHHEQICTVQRSYALIGLIWGVSVMPALADIIIVLASQPLSVFSRTVRCYTTRVFNTPHHQASSTVVQVVLLSFVFVTLMVTYLKVLFAAREASSTERASATKARNTIVLHGVQLLLCMLSYVSTFINLTTVNTPPPHRTNILFTSFLLTNMLPRLLSPLIYGFRDQKFKKHMRMYFYCRNCGSVAKRVKPVKTSKWHKKRCQA
ncbi:odorant receptor 131-2-like [Polymixia lowei]